MSIFRLKLLPAMDGDCLILSWSDGGPLKHMIVDGGRAGTYPHLKKQLAQMVDNGDILELYVLTHIDADHVAGALSYLKDKARPIAPKEVWYNGFQQISGAKRRRSMRQGDEYSAMLAELGWPLNRHFPGGVVSIESASDPLDVAGLKLTILSPDIHRLNAMESRWAEWHRKQGPQKVITRDGTRAASKHTVEPFPDPLVIEDLIDDGDIDTEVPNGTSIAFVAEWQGHRVLFGGDAHPDLLVSSLKPLAEAEGGRYRVDLLKASHHGSMKNTSREFVEMIDCKQVALSTNGSVHSHPDPQAVARFIHFGSQGRKILHFNYDTDRTRPWGAETAMQLYNYEARYPTGIQGMIEIDVMACIEEH